MRGPVLAIVAVLWLGPAAQSAAAQDTCPGGAQVPAQYCHFFVHYSAAAAGEVDQRLGDSLGIQSAEQTRAIAFIIAIDTYPNLPAGEGNLSAARKDRELLKDYLINDQHFDEVIVLSNGEATRDNIDYFLNSYLPSRGLEFGPPNSSKARLLIAYSGHGRSDTTPAAQDAAFVLSQADSFDSAVNVYPMRDLASRVAALSSNYFHVLTLINACYGGNAFVSGWGGSFNDETQPGSFGLTAGSDTKTVVSLQPDKGSLFFDLLISGLQKGLVAPVDSGTTVTIGATTVQQDPITRTGDIIQYLDSAIRNINQAHRNDASWTKLEHIWVGAEQKDRPARGGFFFLTRPPAAGASQPYLAYLMPSSGQSRSAFGGTSAVPAVEARNASAEVEPQPASGSTPMGGFLNSVGNATASSERAGTDARGSGDARGDSDTFAGRASAEAIRNVIPTGGTLRGGSVGGLSTIPVRAPLPFKVPPGPVSSVVGHPDVKIFKSPNIYPIRGYDLSYHDGAIDWGALAAKDKPAFIYALAIGWLGRDRTFEERWRNAAALNIDRGAFMTFNFCKSAADQLKDFTGMVPKDATALPSAILLVEPGATTRQGKCLQRMGDAAQRAEMLKLAAAMQAYYGKIPLFYGNGYNLARFTDERFDDYMLWLARYGDNLSKSLNLPGKNPWSLWQYSGTLKVAGISGENEEGKVTGSVFFGTRDQYALFKQGKTNTALAAVTNPR